MPSDKRPAALLIVWVLAVASVAATPGLAVGESLLAAAPQDPSAGRRPRGRLLSRDAGATRLRRGVRFDRPPSRTCVSWNDAHACVLAERADGGGRTACLSGVRESGQEFLIWVPLPRRHDTTVVSALRGPRRACGRSVR